MAKDKTPDATYLAWYGETYGPLPGRTRAEAVAAAKKAAAAHPVDFNAFLAKVQYGQPSGSVPKGSAPPPDDQVFSGQPSGGSKTPKVPPVTAAAPKQRAAQAAATLDPFAGVGATAFGVVSSYANFVPNSTDPDAIQHRVAGPAYENAQDYAKEHLTQLDESQLRVIQQQLQDGGYLGKGHTTGVLDMDTFSGYAKLLQDTSLANTAGTIITPEDYLRKVAKENKNTTTTHTSTSQSRTLASPDDARSLALQTFRQALGRAPHPAELAAFQSALMAYESSHPNVTNTTATTDAEGNTRSSSSTTTGGGNDAQFAQDYVAEHDQTEQQSYAAGTAYFQAALDVLRAGGGGFTNDPIANAHASEG